MKKFFLLLSTITLLVFVIPACAPPSEKTDKAQLTGDDEAVSAASQSFLLVDEKPVPREYVLHDMMVISNGAFNTFDATRNMYPLFLRLIDEGVGKQLALIYLKKFADEKGITLSDIDVDAFREKFANTVGVEISEDEARLRATAEVASNELVSELAKVEHDRKIEMAQQAYSKLQNGATFEDVARESQALGDSTIDAIDTGMVRISELAPNLARAVATLEEGQFTEPIDLDVAYVIARLETKASAEGPDFEEFKKGKTKEDGSAFTDEELRFMYEKVYLRLLVFNLVTPQLVQDHLQKKILDIDVKITDPEIDAALKYAEVTKSPDIKTIDIEKLIDIYKKLIEERPDYFPYYFVVGSLYEIMHEFNAITTQEQDSANDCELLAIAIDYYSDAIAKMPQKRSPELYYLFMIAGDAERISGECDSANRDKHIEDSRKLYRGAIETAAHEKNIVNVILNRLKDIDDKEMIELGNRRLEEISGSNPEENAEEK